MSNNNVTILAKDNNTLSSDDYPFDLPLRRSDFENDKEIKKFVKSCKFMIRRCPEYKEWIKYIHTVLGVYKCEITGELNNQTTVDIHHHPVSIENIVNAVVMKFLSLEKEFCSFDICSKVIELHFSNKIGYIPLVTSMHDKFHRGYLELPMDLIHGDYQYFIDNYMSFLSDDEIDVINERLSITKKNIDWEQYNWVREIMKDDDVVNG